MKKVLFVAAIYTLIIHQCTKKSKVDISARLDQRKLQASGKSIRNPVITPSKKEPEPLNEASSFVRNIE